MSSSSWKRDEAPVNYAHWRDLCIRRTLCRHVTIDTPMIIFAVLTVFDCFWWLVHCWYSLGRHVTIGTLMVIFAVLTVFWPFLNRQKQLKTIGVPIVTCLPRLYQQCTNNVPIVKNSQKTVKTAKMTISVPIVTSTQSPPNTQSHISSRWNVEHCDD